MPEITFVFGPNNSFFFDCPKTWKFHNIPHTLRQLFNSSMSPAWRIAQPYCLALAPQYNAPEPVWYCGCRVLAGEEKLFFSQIYFDQNYPSLAQWAKAIPNAPSTCFITFGPGLSYFACAPGHGSVWAGVPSALTDKVQKAHDTPTHVSLGVDQSWFVLWPDGYFAWDFRGAYRDLGEILARAAPRSVAYLSISPYSPSHYFLAFKDRTIKYNFSGAPEWMPIMHDVFQQWQAEALVQQNPYAHPQPPPPGVHTPQQWSQYLPNPSQPAYIAAHYAAPHSPPLSPGYQNLHPHQNQHFAAELPSAVPPPQACLSPGPTPSMSFVAELPGDTPTAVITPPLASPAISAISAVSPLGSPVVMPAAPAPVPSPAPAASRMSMNLGGNLAVPAKARAPSVVSADTSNTNTAPAKKRRSIFGWKPKFR